MGRDLLGSRAYDWGTEAKVEEAPFESKRTQGEKSLFPFAI